MPAECPTPDPVTNEGLCHGPSPLDSCYRVVDQASGAIEFEIETEGYRFYRKHLLAIGVDIDTLRTKHAFNLAILSPKFLNTTMAVIQTKWAQCNPENLEQALMQAHHCGNESEAKRIYALLHKRKVLGLRVIE